MTSRAQFEAMLEALINDDQEAAKDIFHNIVVGKSREIYEELLAEDFNFDEAADEEDSEHDEGDDIEDRDDGTDTSEFGDDDTEDGDADLDFDSDEHDGEESDEPLEDRVVDLEDALEDLKAEFERLMADEKNEPEHDDIFGHEDESEEDVGDEGDFNFGQGDSDEGEDDHKMFEYVNKVSLPKHGDDGVNVKSPVACKNDMGGTAANIARGGEAKAGGTKGGLLDPSTKDLSGGNVNVPGSNRAAKLHGVSKGHGAEKKGAGETADNKRSIFSGKR